MSQFRRPPIFRGAVPALVERRVRELQQAVEVFGESDPRALLLRARLAAALRQSGQLTQSLAAHETTPRLFAEIAPEWPLAAGALSDLGVTVAATGRLDVALGLHEDALSQLTRTAPALDPVRLAVTANQAATLRALGRYSQALEIQTGVVRLLADTYGEQNPIVLDAMARRAATLGAAGDFDAAQQAWSDVAVGRAEAFGRRDPLTLSSLGNLGDVLRGAGNLQDALRVHTDVVEALGETLPAEHPSALSARQDLALTLGAAGRLVQSRELTEQVVTGRSRVLGPDHPQTLASLRILGQTLRALGDEDSAAVVADRRVRGSRRMLGDEHPDTVRAIGERDEERRVTEQQAPVFEPSGLDVMGGGGLSENVAATILAADEFAEGALAQPPADTLGDTPPRGRIVRTPHLATDPDGPIATGREFRVLVWADRKAAGAGEDSQPVDVSLAPGTESVIVSVLLVVSRHFDVLGDPVQPLRLHRAEDSTKPLEFRVVAAESFDAIDEEDEPFAEAVFSLNGRPAGRIRRVLPIVAPAGAAA